MPKIHFAALFGVDYELDLMYFWLSYYRDMNLDSYKVFLHREEGNIGNDIIRQFKMEGFNVECVGGPQGNGMLRKVLLGHYASTLPEEDFLVTADADEFQSCPRLNGCAGYGDYHVGVVDPAPPDYRRLLEKYDCMTGFMTDRYADRLETGYKWPFAQYPFEEPFTREYLKAFTPPYLRKTKWPETRRTKILAARCGYEVGYEGSHCAMSLPSNARIAEEFRVYHFAWRESARLKAVAKSYYTIENLSEIFGGKIPENCLKGTGMGLRNASDDDGVHA